MKVGGFNFIRTCGCCPEQYDVKDEQGNQVAYIRLRWGVLECKVPDAGGYVIYRFGGFERYMQGSFESEEQRQYHLKRIAEALVEIMNEK